MCRVNYDVNNWNLIAQQLKTDHTAIHVINRAQIIDDAINLAMSDLLDYETALSMTGYLSNEVEYIPWASALTGTETSMIQLNFTFTHCLGLSYINKMLKRTPAYGDFKR